MSADAAAPGAPSRTETPARKTLVDLTRSLPPPAKGLDAALRRSMRLAAEDDEALHLVARASSPAGSEKDRLAAALWLEPRFGESIDPERIVLSNGTQSAVLALLDHHLRSGKILAAENLSYGVLRELAEVAGVEVAGVQLDEEGLMPDHLDAVCRTRRVGALYCNPTFHNPTTAIMSETRRLAIAEVARRHGVPIIEDDPIGRLYDGLPRPIAALAPDVTWHVSGLTKCIAQGMRMAYLVAPDRRAAQCFAEANARRSNWVAAPLMALLLRRMVESGLAAGIAAEIAAENTAREVAARRILDCPDMLSKPGSPHTWLPLRGNTPPESLVERLKAEGVLVRPASMFAVDGTEPPKAVRLSLSSPYDRASVIEGLGRVAEVLRDFRC